MGPNLYWTRGWWGDEHPFTNIHHIYVFHELVTCTCQNLSSRWFQSRTDMLQVECAKLLRLVPNRGGVTPPAQVLPCMKDVLQLGWNCDGFHRAQLGSWPFVLAVLGAHFGNARWPTSRINGTRSWTLLKCLVYTFTNKPRSTRSDIPWKLLKLHGLGAPKTVPNRKVHPIKSPFAISGAGWTKPAAAPKEGCRRLRCAGVFQLATAHVLLHWEDASETGGWGSTGCGWYL